MPSVGPLLPIVLPCPSGVQASGNIGYLLPLPLPWHAGVCVCVYTTEVKQEGLLPPGGASLAKAPHGHLLMGVLLMTTGDWNQVEGATAVACNIC